MIDKKLKVKLLVVGLLLVLCLGVASFLFVNTATVFATASTEEINSSKFEIIDYQGKKVNATYIFNLLNENECSISLSNLDEATTANIPSEAKINGKKYTITEVATNGFMGAPNLIKVKLPDSIKKINNSAFANCPKLKFMDLANVQEIGNNVFFKCPELSEIMIPKATVKMGSNVFRNNNTKIRA